MRTFLPKSVFTVQFLPMSKPDLWFLARLLVHGLEMKLDELVQQ